jgi:hypothetical protein
VSSNLYDCLVRRVVLGLVGFALPALMACGRGALRPADGDGGSPATAGDATASDAACASPTICDDDPDAAAHEGTCQPFAGSWYCDCADGFSINPKTNRCRRGTMCIAAAADAWPFRNPFDTSDCATRMVTTCPAPPPSPDDTPPEEELLRGLYLDCKVPAYLTVRVETVGACPTLLEGRGLNPTLSDQELSALACLAPKLSQLNVACHSSSGCFLYEYDDALP